MPSLVSLSQVKNALRIDSGDFDSDLDLKIAAASEAVLEYVKGTIDDYLVEDSETEVDATLVPDRMKAATIMLTGYLFRNPDSDPEKAFEMGYLPKPVMALLYQLRDPTVG